MRGKCRAPSKEGGASHDRVKGHRRNVMMVEVCRDGAEHGWPLRKPPNHRVKDGERLGGGSGWLQVHDWNC